MNGENITFGKIILDARKKKGLKLKELAQLILKEDGSSVSFQYLNDLELDNRNPPAERIINQFSQVLDIPIEVLYFYAGIFPKNLRQDISQDKIITAYNVFVKSLS